MPGLSGAYECAPVSGASGMWETTYLAERTLVVWSQGQMPSAVPLDPRADEGADRETVG